MNDNKKIEPNKPNLGPQEPPKPNWPGVPKTENKAVTGGYKKQTIFQVLTAIIALVLIVVLLGTLKNPGDKSEVESAGDTALSVREMQPVTEGEYVYQFEGVKWIFEDQGDGTTKVNMMFENFSRHEDAYVTFGKPYKLGSYSGTCAEVDTIDINPEIETGIALAFAKCQSGSVISEIVLFQEWEDVVAKKRIYTEGTVEYPLFEPIYTIVLTEVVR